MFHVPLGLLLLLLMPLLVLGVVIPVVIAGAARPDATLTSEVASARRHAVTTSVLSVALTVATLLGVSATAVLGVLSVPARGLACAPLAATLVALLVLLVGELTWPRPTGVSRTALLHDRSARVLLGGGWPRACVGTVAVVVLALVAGGALGDSTGGTITHLRSDGADTAGPFPGWSYGGPQLVVLAACLCAALLTIRATARRSAVVTADVATDLLLRRASVARTCRALVAGCLLTLGADLLAAGGSAQNAFDSGLPHTVAVCVLAAGPLTALLGLIALVVPVPRLPGTDRLAAPPTESAVSA